ncbi:MAG: shikimate kinase [Clostridium sp.]
MNRKIALIGMPGCGKTTIGDELSKRIGLKLIDLDKFIEEFEGKTIKDMFNISEEVFREAESRALMSIEEENIILSTGGGIIKSPLNRKFLKDNYLTIFLDRPLEKILGDVDETTRPLLKDNKNRLISLYEERYDLYKETCKIHLINDSDIDSIISKILLELDKKHN